MDDDDRWRDSRRGDENRRDDRGFAGPRREPRVLEQEGRGYPRQFSGDVDGGDPGREGRNWRPVEDDREGFWGRGHRGSNFERDEHRDYSREDYGATDRGPDYRGASGRGGYFGGEEGRGGQGYGWQRSDFGREASGRSFAGNRGRGFGHGSDNRTTYGGGDRGRSGYGNREGSERGFFERASDEVSSWFGDREAEQRREQDYRGRGPKGYKRSDPRIQEDVNDRLADDPYLDASEIEVGVSNGEVTLSGAVDSRPARRRAEDVAEQVSGVTYVQNNIRVRSGGSGSSATYGAGSMAGAVAATQTGDICSTETAGQNKKA